jgi:hypothetical protein
MSRSSKVTVDSREREVLRMLLDGAEFAEIRQFASDSGWNVTDRQLWRYQRAAYRKVVKITERDRVGLLGRHLMQRRSLYARALKANDIRTALAVLQDEAELQGLYPVKKEGGVNITLHQIDWSELACMSDKKTIEAKRVEQK